MVLTLNNTQTITADKIYVDGTELSNLYATINYVNTNSGGVSQSDFDTEVATLRDKDIAYNNTLQSHISLIDTNTTDIATHTNDISVLNTKQIQNFAGINDINSNLSNNYQTTTQLNSNFVSPTTLTTNHYTKTEIDTTLGNYYTSLQIDAGFYSQTFINSNIYTKTEVDGLIAGAGSSGYTDTQIDSFLSLKEDKSTSTDKISFTPIVDISAPTIIHQGLTLKNSTVNIEPLAVLTFSNQFGAETDRDVAVFKNQTNYISMKGNKTNCNATSDDSIANLRLNPAGNIEFSNVILPLVGADLYRPSGNTSYNLRIRDLQGIWEFRNRTLTCRNASNENLDTLMEIQSLGQGQIRLGTASTAQVGIGANPNASYFLTVAGTSNFDVIRSANRLDLIGDMYVKGTGSDIVRPSGDANHTLRVRDTQAVWEFRNRNFRCMNPSNPANGTEMIIHHTGNDYRLRIGSTSNAQVGIGRQYNSSYFLTVGGTRNFNEARVENNLNLLGEQLLNSNARIFQRADAFNSLNVISTAQINCSLQSDRTTDPTTGTIAIQLDDTNGITINRAVTNNQTFNSIGNITAEASLNVWGDLLFQHSSGIKETLNGSDYDLDIRNGDTDRATNLRIGAIGSTPELSLSEAKVTLLGNLEITHVDVSGSQRVLINNPDTDGFIRLSNNNLSRLDATNSGVDVCGVFTTTGNADIGGNVTCVALTETSDAIFKENVKEVNTKECYKAVKYIKPKTYNFIKDENKKSNLGFIADDIKDAKMPKEWDNILYYNDDGTKLIAYNKMTVVLWGCVQEMQKEITNLKTEISKLKNKSN